MDINKVISPFIAGQFPEFYRSEGKNFIAFVRAYYEWMEQDQNTIGEARNLLNIIDIDRTEEQFLKYFQSTYISSIPETIASDKRQLVKYCLDLYRSKGSSRAVELLFRILFNEDIEVYTPGSYLLRPSDGVWQKNQYIEVTSNPNLSRIIGKTITTSTGSASGVVESSFRKVIEGRVVNVIYLSNIKGTFKYSDRIVCNGIIEFADAPIVIGSLSAIPVENGGFGFQVGDILDVSGTGDGGKARVASTRNEDGKVRFTLVNGGSGYSVNAVVTVATTINLLLQGNTTFANGASIVDLQTNANGTVVFSNTSYATLINFSNNLEFTVGSSVSDGSNSATIVDVIGGGGTGATFKVGQLVDKEIYIVNTDKIEDYESTTIETQVRLGISGATGTFSPGNIITNTANTIVVQGTYITSNTLNVNTVVANASLGIANLRVITSDDRLFRMISTQDQLTNSNLVSGAIIGVGDSYIQLDRAPHLTVSQSQATVFSSNSTAIIANTSGDTLFVHGTSVVVQSTPTTNATISFVERTTNWFFPARAADVSNLDKKINETLTVYPLEVGTIASLIDVNPGSGYSSPPYVQVVEPEIALANELDDAGNIKGRNAVVDAVVSNETGIVTSLEVFDSGLGYVPNETLFLTKAGLDASVRGVAVVTRDGEGQGSYRGTSGFPDEDYKIQDGDYYQIYSYEIIAKRMKSTFEKLVNDLVHPAGYKMFARYRNSVQLVNNEITLVSSSVTSQ